MNAAATTTGSRVLALVSSSYLRQARSRAGDDAAYAASVGRWCRSLGEAGASMASTSHVARPSPGPAHAGEP